DSRVRMAAFPADGDYGRLLRDADGLILPYRMAPPEAIGIDLGTDETVLVRAKDSAPVQSIEALSHRPWVVVEPADEAHTGSIRHLLASGVRLQVIVDLPTSSSVHYFVEGTDRLAVLPRSLGERLERSAAIAIQRLPLLL